MFGREMRDEREREIVRQHEKTLTRNTPQARNRSSRALALSIGLTEEMSEEGQRHDMTTHTHRWNGLTDHHGRVNKRVRMRVYKDLVDSWVVG